MDLKTLGPVVGALLNAGAPAISTVVQMAFGEIPVVGGVIGPLVGMALPSVLSSIAGNLGISTTDKTPEALAGDITTAIDADPDGSKARLATLESQHTFDLANRDKDIAQTGQQVEILKLDASSGSWLGRNWRPLCATGLALFLGMQLVTPYIVWLASWMGLSPPVPPEPRFDVTVAMLSGLLGLGVMRSFDKTQGTAAGQTKTIVKPVRK